MALIIALLVLTLLSFGRILSLSFGWDDYTSLYFTVHNKLFQYPYYADQFRFVPLFRLFGLSPMPYYAVSLVLFFVDALLLVILAYRITNNRAVAVVTAVFFIVSFVGSDSMYYAVEGLRNTQFLLLLLATLFAYISFQKAKRQWLYAATLAGFIIITVVFPYRAFFVLPLLFVVDRSATKPDLLKTTLLRLLPFLFIDLFLYLVLPKLPGVKNIMGHIRPTSFLATPIWLHVRNFSLTWLYFLIPSSFFTRFPQLHQTVKPFMPWIGMMLFLAPAFFLFRSRPSVFLRLARINFWFLSIVLLSFVLIVNASFTTEYRYLLVARPFAAMFIAGLLFHLMSRSNRQRLIAKFFIFVLTISIVLNVYEHVVYQTQIIDRRGAFAKKVIATIKAHVPIIQRNTLFFLDADENEQRDRFAEATRVGTLPAGASLAVYYGTDYEQIEIADRVHCDVFQSVLETWRGEPVDIYYFFTDGNKIIQKPKERAFELCNITAFGQ